MFRLRVLLSILVCILAGAQRCSAFCTLRSAKQLRIPPAQGRRRSHVHLVHQRRYRSQLGVNRAVAKGFGEESNTRESEAGPVGSKQRQDEGRSRGDQRGPISGADEGTWAREYKAYINRTGKYLCSMSWEGFEKMGRGAIFANYDDARAQGHLNDADQFGGIPSMYVPLKEFMGMREAGRLEEQDDLGQILERLQTYSPEQEFVVVFQAAGIMGTDIVRPNVSPPEMSRHVITQEGIRAGEISVGDDGIIDVTAVEKK